ncbi:MAG: hypothetical protein OEZ04_07640, partial [Nitrospinota bacterium]|nr:hypothetical protein [Nitrospinota bacterium]
MAVIKQEFVRLLRAARIIDIAERLSFWRMAVSWRRNNKAFLADNPGFVAPPLWLLYETTGHASYRMYHRTGAMTAKLI